jgi:hypothetical protein
MKAKQTLTSTPLPSLFNIQIIYIKKLPPIPLQHIKKNPSPLVPSHSTMKKKNLRKNNHPFPFLLPHVKGKQKKTINLHPPFPLDSKKKGKKNQGAPFPPSHNEYNINPGPSQQ